MIRQFVLKRFVQSKLNSCTQSNYEKWEELGNKWKESGFPGTITEFYMNNLTEEEEKEFKEIYEKPSWIIEELPRKYLKAWCDETGYDFITLCRVINDKEVY